MAVEPEPPVLAVPEQEVALDVLRGAVLDALENSGQQMLAHNLEQGEWSIRGSEVSVKVGLSQVLIDVALGDGPERVIQNALSQASGRPLRFKMENGGAQFTPHPPCRARQTEPVTEPAHAAAHSPTPL